MSRTCRWHASPRAAANCPYAWPSVRGAGGARTTGDRQGERLRTLLVAAQIAVTLVLLIGAGLLTHSFVRLTSVSPGFESSGRDGIVQTVRVTLPQQLDAEPERI